MLRYSKGVRLLFQKKYTGAEKYLTAYAEDNRTPRCGKFCAYYRLAAMHSRRMKINLALDAFENCCKNGQNLDFDDLYDVKKSCSVHLGMEAEEKLLLAEVRAGNANLSPKLDPDKLTKMKRVFNSPGECFQLREKTGFELCNYFEREGENNAAYATRSSLVRLYLKEEMLDKALAFIDNAPDARRRNLLMLCILAKRAVSMRAGEANTESGHLLLFLQRETSLSRKTWWRRQAIRESTRARFSANRDAIRRNHVIPAVSEKFTCL